MDVKENAWQGKTLSFVFKFPMAQPRNLQTRKSVEQHSIASLINIASIPKENIFTNC